MNTHDSASSQNSGDTPSKDKVPPKVPTTPPLSSPDEPTRAHPTDPVRTYSSDPSQYSYSSHQPEEEPPAKVYMTESLDTARIANEGKKSSESQAQREEKAKAHAQQTHREANQLNSFYQALASNKEQTITYVLLILSLFLILFVNVLLGSLMLGMVAGYYFAPHIIHSIRNFDQLVEGQNHLHYAVLAAVLLGFFIAVPGIFLGAFIVAVFKQVMTGSGKSKKS